jgi:hypothetical protein
MDFDKMLREFNLDRYRPTADFTVREGHMRLYHVVAQRGTGGT